MNSLRRVAFAGAVFLAGALTSIALAEPSNKWRVELDEVAKSDGTIILRVAPVKGEPIDVETKVPQGKTENEVAHALRDSLKVSLGKGFDVSVDDGEDVLIKKKGKTPKFDLTLVSSSVTGLNIELERE
jgi:hypothetical protein